MASSYNAALLLVPKKESKNTKQWRLEETLNKLDKAKHFNTLYMGNSFQKTKLDDDSIPLTAFSTNNSRQTSSNSFQCVVNVALSRLKTEAFLYVDDIVVYGSSLRHHNNSPNQRITKTRAA